MIEHKLDLLQSQREILKEQYLLMLDKLLKSESIPKSETQKQINSFKKARDLRSIIDTARKRGMNEFEVIRDVFNGKSIF